MYNVTLPKNKRDVLETLSISRGSTVVKKKKRIKDYITQNKKVAAMKLLC